MSIILGIDYGDRRIGLALSDPQEKLARRFLTLQNSAEAMSDLKGIILDNHVEKIVVGLPLGFNGPSQQTEKVRGFITGLREEIGLPVEEMNEIFTSKMAQDNLIKSGVKDIKEVLDQEAARIILQDYMDFRKEV